MRAVRGRVWTADPPQRPAPLSPGTHRSPGGVAPLTCTSLGLQGLASSPLLLPLPGPRLRCSVALTVGSVPRAPGEALYHPTLTFRKELLMVPGQSLNQRNPRDGPPSPPSPPTPWGDPLKHGRASPPCPQRRRPAPLGSRGHHGCMQTDHLPGNRSGVRGAWLLTESPHATCQTWPPAVTKASASCHTPGSGRSWGPAGPRRPHPRSRPSASLRALEGAPRLRL